MVRYLEGRFQQKLTIRKPDLFVFEMFTVLLTAIAHRHKNSALRLRQYSKIFKLCIICPLEIVLDETHLRMEIHWFMGMSRDVVISLWSVFKQTYVQKSVLVDF